MIVTYIYLWPYKRGLKGSFWPLVDNSHLKKNNGFKFSFTLSYVTQRYNYLFCNTLKTALRGLKSKIKKDHISST